MIARRFMFYFIFSALILVNTATSVFAKNESNRIERIRHLSSKHEMSIVMLLPDKVNLYKKKMEDFHEGGFKFNPAFKWKFVQKTIVVPYSSNVLLACAEAAAKICWPFEEKKGLISSFMLKNGVAHIQLKAEVDGWAGSSLYIEETKPIITKTLNYYGVKKVVFDYQN